MNKLTLGVLICVGVVAAGIFQNCSASGFKVLKRSSLNLPSSHPDLESVTDTTMTEKFLIGDRDYLESTFRDVFLTAESTSDEIAYVVAVMLQEFGPVQQLLGRSCSVAENGTLGSCNYTTSNLETAFSAQSSAVREAARIQVCRRVLANDAVLARVVARVKGKQPTPNDESLLRAIQLFHPATESAPELVHALASVDLVMAESSEPVKDRWRMIFLNLCEAPTWQIL